MHSKCPRTASPLFVRDCYSSLFRHPETHVVVATSAINRQVGIISPCDSDLLLLNHRKNEIISAVFLSPVRCKVTHVASLATAPQPTRTTVVVSWWLADSTSDSFSWSHGEQADKREQRRSRKQPAREVFVNSRSVSQAKLKLSFKC